MTRADIETMLTHLAATTRYLQESGRLMREAADHLVRVADYLQEIGTRTEAAITAGLTHLHGDDEGAVEGYPRRSRATTCCTASVSCFKSIEMGGLVPSRRATTSAISSRLSIDRSRPVAGVRSNAGSSG